jgi:hypothetical protein
MVRTDQQDVLPAGHAQEPGPEQPASHEIERAVQIPLDLARKIVWAGYHFEAKPARNVHDLSWLSMGDRDSCPQSPVAPYHRLETFTEARYVEDARDEQGEREVEIEIAQPVGVVPMKPLLKTQRD